MRAIHYPPPRQTGVDPLGAVGRTNSIGGANNHWYTLCNPPMIDFAMRCLADLTADSIACRTSQPIKSHARAK